MPRRVNVFDRLEELENHWDEKCEELKTTEMSINDAIHWRGIFHQERLQFERSMDQVFQNEFYYEIELRLDKNRDNVEAVILEARANFREKEKYV